MLSGCVSDMGRLIVCFVIRLQLSRSFGVQFGGSREPPGYW